VQTNSNQGPAFGMALVCNTAKIGKQLGIRAMRETEKALPALSEEAKNVDIFVMPKKSGFDLENNIINIQVQDLVKPEKNPFLNIIAHIKRGFSSYVEKNVYVNNVDNISDKLISKTIEAKKIHSRSK
jgi:hypothetical protein